MKKFLLGAAAAVAVTAPGVAAAQGYVGGVYTNTEVEAAGVDVEAWGAEGAFLVSPSIEVDAAILDGDDDTAYGLTGHYFFQRNENHLFGGFVGVSGGEDDTAWNVGVEGAKYFSRWTAHGALSYLTADEADVDGFGADLGLSAFASDNIRFDANVGWASLDAGAGDEDAFTYGVGVEFGLGSLPLSLTGSWTHAELDETNVETETLNVGLRYNFNGQSLFERDRSGASQANRAGSFNGLF